MQYDHSSALCMCVGTSGKGLMEMKRVVVDPPRETETINEMKKAIYGMGKDMCREYSQ